MSKSSAEKEILSVELFQRNDSDWYERIFKNGYDHVSEKEWVTLDTAHMQTKWAFFPLYPMSVKATAKVIRSNFVHAGFLNALLFSILCFIIFYFLAVEYFLDANRAFYCAVLFIVFPFHYYFSMLYSESLFALIMMLGFLSLKKEKYLLFMLSALLLPLCRVNGIVMSVPLFFHLLETNQVIENYKIRWVKIDKKLVVKSLMFTAMLLSFAAYCYYQKQLTGTYLAFSRAQMGWWRALKMPYESFFARGDAQSQFNSVYVIFFMLIAVLGFKKLSLSYNILIWISLLLPLVSGSTQSMQRFLIVVFPLMFLIGNFILERFSKYKYVIAVFLFALQLWTFYYWIISDPFSY